MMSTTKIFIRSCLTATVFIAIAQASSFGQESPAKESSKKNKPQSTRSQQANLPNLLPFVNPFIGTDGNGRAFPGATSPFGMIQISPDTDNPASAGVGVQWASGYHYKDSLIVGFSHTHQHGTTVSDLLDVTLMPTTKSVNLVKPLKRRGEADWASAFAHKDEFATPGYYRVKFPAQNSTQTEAKTGGITAELVATELIGMHRYTFPKSDRAAIVLDVSAGAAKDSTTDAAIQIRSNERSNTVITGYRHSTGAIKKQQVFFAMEFTKPIAAFEGTEDGTKLAANFTTLRGAQARAALLFKTAANEQITVKVALSSVSEQGALDALKLVKQATFDQLLQASQTIWNSELGKIELTTKNAADKTLFYTALYHSCITLQRYSDFNSGFAQHVYNDSSKSVVTTINTATGFGDKKYRRLEGFSPNAAYEGHALWTLLQGERMMNVIESNLSHYHSTGTLPKRTLWGNELVREQDLRPVQMLIETYRKGYANDLKEILDSIYVATRQTAMMDSATNALYEQYRYLPADKVQGSVAVMLERIYTDGCMKAMAGFLDRKEDLRSYSDRAEYWRRIFERESKLMQPKLSNGAWKQPIHQDSLSSDYGTMTPRQWSFFLPHDVTGLIGLNNSSMAINRRLDSMFAPLPSGGFAHYDHTEPRQHWSALLPLFANAPAKMQARVRQITRAFYKPTADGLVGADDGSHLSAWFAFAAIGLYPFHAQQTLYYITSPLVEKAVIAMPTGKTFTIKVKNASEKNIYVKAARLDGELLTQPFIPHRQLLLFGGTLELEMTDKPTTLWDLF